MTTRKILGFPLVAFGTLALVYGGSRHTGLFPIPTRLALATAGHEDSALLPIGGIALIGGIVIVRAPRRRNAPAWFEINTPNTHPDAAGRVRPGTRPRESQPERQALPDRAPSGGTQDDCSGPAVEPATHGRRRISLVQPGRRGGRELRAQSSAGGDFAIDPVGGGT